MSGAERLIPRVRLNRPEKAFSSIGGGSKKCHCYPCHRYCSLGSSWPRRNRRRAPGLPLPDLLPPSLLPARAQPWSSLGLGLGLGPRLPSFPPFPSVHPMSRTSPARDPMEPSRSRWERQRRRAEKTLLETEQDYSQRLDLVATYFVAILKVKGTLKPVVLEAIFGPWESLCSASRMLLFHLEKGHLGLGLESFCHQLIFYIRYAEKLEEAKKMLEKQVKKNKSFSHFKKLQESRPDFKSCRLEDLLSLPLQRVYQYKHLLQDLVENTCPESSDFDQLRGVLESFSEVFLQIQEISSFQDNLKHMCRVQKLLKGQKTHVLVPGRWYLQEGWLMVVPPKGEKMQPRMFFLFSDILLMTNPCHPLHPWNSSKFSCQAAYPLSQCSVEKVFGHTHSQGGLLSLSFPHKTLLLLSFNQDLFDRWYQNLVTAVRELQTGSSSLH